MDKDLSTGEMPHYDALVIAMDVNRVVVRRTLVDTGSSVNVLHLETFTKMGMAREQLAPVKTPLTGFTGDSVEAEESITLLVEVGSYPSVQKLDMKFIVVDLTCSHNAILGRPGLEDLGALISIEHLCMKFCTPSGVGTVRCDRKVARHCYLQACRGMGKREMRVHEITERPTKKAMPPCPEPALELEEVEIDLARLERRVRIGVGLKRDVREEVIRVLRENRLVFSWGPEDMSGVDRSIISHRLAVDPGYRPMIEENFSKRKKIRCWLPAISERSSIRNGWPTWIDQLVDETAGSALLSFIDAFRGYHQIYMHKADEEKTTFLTSDGVYCYQVMPFGLKNAGATYTRMVAWLFQDLLGKSMATYVDDMLVKSRDESGHAGDLADCFQVMLKCNLRLNPKKCAFAVQGGKFLGYMVTKRGIEPNPEKVQAVMDM
ncbi:PREDICTED: uncharacterized protein LOC109158277 [Ipomoea nil]|uniref:uncharacterized protein LOC109158277 n=1 Tax=Ipomoea nil TaxID=35883 RepID=UPI000901DBD5|nr:PREDICTED: uncharacterized protein LOC109158277 [Ipomoea nil]